VEPPDDTKTVSFKAVLTPRPRDAGASNLLPRGTSVGRYTVLELVGRGGMGDVYAAYDPKLDRKIALKLIVDDDSRSETRSEARLLREAQAIAKVSHPNVVTVHDAGTFGGRVFIAMEFIEGGTLKKWLADAPRARGEILAVFSEAARGLAAAHAAGLVHRDFKPLNVMVARDRTVRVTDFGLVRQLAEPGPEGGALAPVMATPAPGAGEAALDLTRTGDMVGTPRYMAPEQFKGGPLDARTDQFSFCVALYEALYGQPPFASQTLPGLVTSVLEGRVAPPPAKTAVPGWLRRVLLRGLEVDPTQRFPSMGALLTALETDPTARRRRLGVAVGVLACVTLAAVGARRVGAGRPALCRGGGERWSSVWAEGGLPTPGKEAIHRTFAATGASYAEAAFTGATRALDAYVGKWIAMYTDACEATQVRGEQSAEVLDLRMGCLQERFGNASALVEVLAHADATVVQNAVSAAQALPTLDRCADLPLLRAVVKPPADEASRRRVEALRGELARLSATRDAGRCAEAERLAQELIPRVREARYLPLLAETLDASALLVETCIDFPVARARWVEAFDAALASRHDEIATRAAMLLAGFTADRTSDTGEARAWLDTSKAMLARTGNPPALIPLGLQVEAMILLKEQRGKEAVAVEERVLRETEAVLGKDHPDLEVDLNSYGNALHLVGRDADALAAFHRAADLVSRLFGAEHPRMAIIAENEGEVLLAMRRDADALAAFERSVAISRRTSANPVVTAWGLTGEGEALVALGRPTAAIPPLEEALRTRVDRHVEPEVAAETRFALAQALGSDRTERPRALTLARQAREDLAKGVAGAERDRKVAQIDAWLAER
jgi:tetratricopeptide (TPR) repeat protein/predicted Ser/Thr protein kinase